MLSLNSDFDLKGTKSTMQANPALMVKKTNGAEITPKTGGKFTFSVLAKKPNTYMHYNLFLRKEGSNWVLKDEKGVKKSLVDLTPNISGFDWNGTFGSVDFE